MTDGKKPKLHNRQFSVHVYDDGKRREYCEMIFDWYSIGGIFWTPTNLANALITKVRESYPDAYVVNTATDKVFIRLSYRAPFVMLDEESLRVVQVAVQSTLKPNFTLTRLIVNLADNNKYIFLCDDGEFADYRMIMNSIYYKLMNNQVKLIHNYSFYSFDTVDAIDTSTGFLAQLCYARQPLVDAFKLWVDGDKPLTPKVVDKKEIFGGYPAVEDAPVILPFEYTAHAARLKKDGWFDAYTYYNHAVNQGIFYDSERSANKKLLEDLKDLKISMSTDTTHKSKRSRLRKFFDMIRFK